MLAIKFILGLCMAHKVLAETDWLNAIRALSNDRVINANNVMEVDRFILLTFYFKDSIGTKFDLILDLLAEQEVTVNELRVRLYT